MLPLLFLSLFHCILSHPIGIVSRMLNDSSVFIDPCSNYYECDQFLCKYLQANNVVQLFYQPPIAECQSSDEYCCSPPASENVNIQTGIDDNTADLELNDRESQLTVRDSHLIMLAGYNSGRYIINITWCDSIRECDYAACKMLSSEVVYIQYISRTPSEGCSN